MSKIVPDAASRKDQTVAASKQPIPECTMPQYATAPSLLPQKWLVLRLSALGDVTLITGVLDYWHKKYGWTFHVLTKEQSAPVFLDNPAVTKVCIFPTQKNTFLHDYAFFKNLTQEYAGWGLLDLHDTLRSRLLACLWNGPVRRYPKQSLLRRFFLLSAGRIGKKKLLQYNVPQRYSLAIEQQAPPSALLHPHIYVSEQAKHTAAQQIQCAYPALATQEEGLAPAIFLAKPLVALHPFATHPNKAWPAAQWEALIQLLEKAGISWIILGMGQAVFPNHPADFTNRTTLREVCALLANATVLVTGDSGPLHLACAVNTPVIALFGPTTREWGFYPDGDEHQVIEAETPCRPCSLHGKEACKKSGDCMQSISPEQVFTAIVTKIQKNSV